jgi:ABC-type antimicrobial peptide transport system permease subunit
MQEPIYTLREDLLQPGAWRSGRDGSTWLFGAFAVTAVLLAVVGLNSLVSYAVSQRTQEIGLRMAIGASQGDVLRMILRQAMTLGLWGIGIGVALTAAGAGFVSSVIPSLPSRPSWPRRQRRCSSSSS